MEKDEKNMAKNTLAAEAESDLVIKLKKPITFEEEQYDKIDLTKLDEVKAADMVAINRRLTRSGNVDTSQEVSLEYALHMANIATGLPLEFFDQLPPYAAIAVRRKVIDFLFGQG